MHHVMVLCVMRRLREKWWSAIGSSWMVLGYTGPVQSKMKLALQFF